MKSLLAIGFFTGVLAVVSTVENAAAAARPALVAPADLQNLSTNAEKELRENILPFWLKNVRDREHGGFHAFIGEDMSVRDDQPRGALLTSRILWTFSTVYRKYHDPEYLDMARWAYRDLMENFVDKEYGGVFWSIGPDEKQRDARKQIYGQVFALYALSEYFRATGEQPALDQAIAIYRLIEKHASDPQYGGYFDSLSREWQQEKRTRGGVLGPAAPKSQNSHIHILEGYTNLLRVWPDSGLRRRHRELIELMLTRILDPRAHHLVLFMKNNWKPIGDEISYGHDIELSWLLVEAAEESGDPVLLDRVKKEAVVIANVTNAEGVDRDGGIFNEGSPHGLTNTNKEWWEQAEAAVGFLNAYQVSGDPQQFARAVRSWNFIQDKLVDREHGDWHNTLKRDGTPILGFTSPDGKFHPTAKANIWKCPYHNSRACLQLIERVQELTKAGAAP